MADAIDKWCEIVEKYCDSPKLFIEAGGYYLTSVLLGRFFRCPQLPQRGRPNIWIILSSIPGRMRRSTLQHYANYVFKNALLEFYDRIGLVPDTLVEEELEGLSEEERREVIRAERERMIDDCVIEEGTPEGIMDAIEATGQNVYTIVSTEIGSVFQRMRARDYQMGVLTLLSKLYYGEGGSILLSRRGGRPGVRRLPPGLYVTMFSGMQEPKYYLDYSMVRQGLLRRILIVYVEAKELDRWIPPLREGRDEIYDELLAYAGAMAKLMERFHVISSSYTPPVLDILFNPRAIERINELAEELDRMLVREESDANIYRQGLWEHLAKLSMLRRIAEGRLERLGDFYQMTVRTEHVEKALEFLKPISEKVDDIILSLGEERQPIRTYEDPLDRIYRIIASAGPSGISRADLYRKAKMRARELDELLATLIRMEKREKIEGTSTGGRIPILYRAKE